jgi:hypothetical protein
VRQPLRALARRQGARVFECERAGPAFGHDWTHDLLSFAGFQVAFLIPIECDDDMIGHGQFQAGSRAQYGAAVALQGSACERDASSRSRAKRRSACPSLPLV